MFAFADPLSFPALGVLPQVWRSSHTTVVLTRLLPVADWRHCVHTEHVHVCGTEATIALCLAMIV